MHTSILPRGAATVLAVALVVVLAWRVVATGLDARSARDRAPVGAAADAPSAASGADALRQRLRRNPADATTLLELALDRERQGRRDEASAAMRATLALAPADPRVLIQVAGYLLRSGDEAGALEIFRRAADVVPGDPSDIVMRALVAALDTGRHGAFFEGLARADPAWWPGFFRRACATAMSAGAVAALVTARAEAAVASAAEWRCVIERLQREGQWARAHQLWLNSLPVEQRQRIGHVFNGGFELPISNTGFDWIVPPQEGVVVATEAKAGANGRRALRVSFGDRRVGEAPLHQYLLLAPGRHRLEGRGRSELESWVGLQWGIDCDDGSRRAPRPLARSTRFAAASDWTDFRVDFVVPGDCPVQRLRLELAGPAASVPLPAARVKGTAWFDDLRIRFLD